MMETGMRGGMRRAVVADASAIARIHVETWRAAYAGVLPDSYLVGMTRGKQAAGWVRAIASERAGFLTLVMEEAGAGIVGFVSAGPVRKSGLPHDCGIKGEVCTLYVGSDWQGRGYGRALLQGALANLFENDLGGVVVWVLEANPSRFFYEAMGGARLATRHEMFAGADVGEIGYVWHQTSWGG